MNWLIEPREHPTDLDRRAISDPLEIFSAARAIPYKPDPIALLVKELEREHTNGGLWANVYYDWMHVELLFVPQKYRGIGIGSQLIRHAENMALQRGCVGVWLDTYQFQAPGFYESLGYENFGYLPNYPRGFGRYFFRKQFADHDHVRKQQ
ncbi:GNAT family N-acetyltransferase [Mesorhizobium sp. M2A.F.Ca.ET.039.01.1.1]|uniref:GNAT family N-acetyltransferase n=1 Tax=unclassified Mesorhizobium TaxID=325217 RepID=UPI000FCB07BB|nr:GNAT family N-acetyltransferase [Mesorhizobium sp. M2A.F.Ca.ET.039.01.1.1]RWB58751.1 MAG: N-acetyltransferase [Mesorhizobium sp.]RWX64029.1 GNAT family N-acetyltransferase [Mesorhizobium sp. M2A.F.Ca.ET.039.01.1.1]